MEKETTQLSYERHAEQERYLELASCYTNSESVDAWRHDRMIGSVLPLITSFPQATWMTIGDGRYGADAYFLKKHKIDVLATSLTDNSLILAKEKGYIDKYQCVNAEEIPFPDNSFDFVLCKESYHHFPRPSIAFYEMLRVARMAIILIEPTDDRIGLINFLKRPLKKMIRKEQFFDYEQSGNYIFRVNSKEMKKMLTALDKPLYAIENYNDFYLKRIAGDKSNMKTFGFLLTKFAIFVQDVLCVLGLMSYGKSTIIAFKVQIPLDLRHKLKKEGFKLTHLPKNPYLN
jgi:Methylase involved in ubiquinone/menaquinone biosynthesis